MIETLPLFRPLQQKLNGLLLTLGRADWNKRTVAGNWTVKDVAAHLLDTTLRGISMYRDGWELPPPAIASYQDLVGYLNRLNGDWVDSLQRVSPEVLMAWLRETHEAFVACLEQLDLHAPARYSVAWAGEEVSENWFHIAREYTEKWHHQQQIREAVGQQAILTREFYHPVLDTFMSALPYQYRNTPAAEGTRVALKVDSEAGGTWSIEMKKFAWSLTNLYIPSPDVQITIGSTVAWKLFTKAVRYETVKDSVTVIGDHGLALPALRMISVIA